MTTMTTVSSKRIDTASVLIGGCVVLAMFAAWDARDSRAESAEHNRMTQAYIFQMHKACSDAGVRVPPLPQERE